MRITRLHKRSGITRPPASKDASQTEIQRLFCTAINNIMYVSRKGASLRGALCAL